MTQEVVIVSAVRTAIGAFQGTLKDIAAPTLARQASIQAGIPVTVPAMTINKVCGSGLKAVHLAAQAILAGDAEIVVAGGFENLSQAPYVMQNAREGFRMGDQKIIDTMSKDGLWCAFN